MSDLSDNQLEHTLRFLGCGNRRCGRMLDSTPPGKTCEARTVIKNGRVVLEGKPCDSPCYFKTHDWPSTQSAVERVQFFDRITRDAREQVK